MICQTFQLVFQINYTHIDLVSSYHWSQIHPTFFFFVLCSSTCELCDTGQHYVDKFDVERGGQKCWKNISSNLALFFSLLTNFGLVNFPPELPNVLVNKQLEQRFKKPHKGKQNTSCESHDSTNQQKTGRGLISVGYGEINRLRMETQINS